MIQTRRTRTTACPVTLSFLIKRVAWTRLRLWHPPTCHNSMCTIPCRSLRYSIVHSYTIFLIAGNLHSTFMGFTVHALSEDLATHCFVVFLQMSKLSQKQEWDGSAAECCRAVWSGILQEIYSLNKNISCQPFPLKNHVQLFSKARQRIWASVC